MQYSVRKRFIKSFRLSYNLLLLLSHVQASVERKFSVNKEVLVEHLAETSFVAQWTIVDHVSSVDGFLKVN
jgi:transcriptional antiterminator